MEEDKMSISVVYWSGTGNTQAMAEAVAEGINFWKLEMLMQQRLQQEMHSHWAARPWVQSSWKKLRWSRLLRRSSHWYQERQSSCSVLMAGAMENGCVTGQNA